MDGIVSCGFPIESINKIMAKLENKKINYLIVDRRNNYDVDEFYDNKNLNTYNQTYEKAKQYILPLPPLAEQQRIVAKIEETFSIFDGIQNSLEA